MMYSAQLKFFQAFSIKRFIRAAGSREPLRIRSQKARVHFALVKSITVYLYSMLD